MTATHTAKIVEEIGIGLEAGQRQTAVDILAAILCNQHVLYLKTRNFHWNLKGPRFHDLHEFFENQYRQLEGAIDETAERIRMLGGVSPGSMAEFLGGASLKEAAGEIIHGDDAIAALIADHDTVIRDLRGQIPRLEEVCNDMGSADFVTELLQAHEKAAWMLRSYVA